MIASEELENHPDPADFENALVRLNPWLESCAPSRDFQPCAEFDARSEEFRLLAETAEEIHTLCAKVSAPREGDAAGAAGLSDDEAGALAEGTLVVTRSAVAATKGTSTDRRSGGATVEGKEAQSSSENANPFMPKMPKPPRGGPR